MDDSAKRLRTVKPPLFSPSVNRYYKDGSANDSYVSKTDSELQSSTALGITGSFRYNIQEDGLVSTQQLNIDWSDFSNHTFFNSAQVKTNIAFEKIINEFPFDGTKKEIELFMDGITGFEKWVYDRLPKNKGYLFFSGSANSSDTGTVVQVKDSEGSLYPTVSRATSGKTILDPGTDSMTVEMHLYVASQSLGDRNQYVLSKISGSNGFGIVSEIIGSTSASSNVSMLVCQNGLQDKVTIPVEFNTWHHLSWVWDRTPGIETIFGYKDGMLTTSSSMPIEFDSFTTNGATVYVGSGSAVGTFTPNNTFSGSIDELRIWHSVRSTSEQKDNRTKPVYSNGKLKLYFKFNEPTGSQTNLVLDYSGNSLHGKLNTTGVSLGVRELSGSFTSGDSPMVNEPLSLSPVLFPNVTDTLNLKLELLVSASRYDNENPNIITKLVPPHYFDEGQSMEGFENLEGDIIYSNTNGDNPRENNLGSTQVLLSLLYTWAKFFDEMKLYIQAFSSLNKLSYDETDTIPNDFLSVFARTEGIDLPPLFVGSSIEQYIEGQNLDNTTSYNIFSLQSVQNQIWKRILINLQDIVRSKGTIHSVKAFIRAVGIDPDSNFRIREYGGPTKNPIEFNRETRTESSTMLNFSSSINILNGSQFTNGSPGLIVSELLTGSKTEPGWPYAGPNAESNGLLTSGSFTFEGTYRFPTAFGYINSQSLARLQLTGSEALVSGSILMNLVADKASNNITLYSQVNPTASIQELKLQLTGVDIFDGQKWYVSFGKQRNDDPESDSVVSASYFIRAARNDGGQVVEQYTTSSYVLESSTSVFNNKLVGMDGIVLKIGNEVPNLLTGSAPIFVTSSVGTSTFLQGRVGQIRFWSKYLNDVDWKEHVRYYRSVGVRDPSKNWNFASTNVSGSWNRLRLDVSTDQPDTTTDSTGKLHLTDFTQNNLGMSGSGFLSSTTVVVPEQYRFSFMSPKIDQGVTTNKVRIRGFQDASKVEASPWANQSPVTEVNPFEESSDSTKLSIDFSIIDSLDQDIMTIFSSLEELNNILGDPNLQFASDYKGLETIRDLYFNKLNDKINIKGFFEFYKWFDTNIGTFVERLLPRKTDFLGTNFVIESHLLERAKVQYHSEDIYLGEDIRSGLKDKILLQLITGKIGLY